jgi:hypothetical protein
LRQTSAPYQIVDSAKAAIDTISHSGTFNFYNAPSGIYFIVTNHFNTIETWSKSGGETLISNGVAVNYDFTASASQAYGNNMTLKGSRYCIYSGDPNKDGIVDLTDVLMIYNDAANFISGSRIPTDLNADGFVDLTDLTVVYNNASNFVQTISPLNP